MGIVQGQAALAGLAVLLGATVAACPGAARACSYSAPAPHVVDPTEAALDVTPPGAVGRVEASVKRGHGLQSEGCGQGLGTDSCADMGTVHLQFDGATDDRTAPADMGYRLEVAEGDDPGFLWGDLAAAGIRVEYLEAGRAGLWLPWVDGDSNAQEPLDLVLRITPVDRAGREGPSVDVDVGDPGSGGCGAGPAGPLGLLPASLVALAALCRRLLRAPR